MKIGQGTENAKKYIEEHADLRQMLYEKATQTSDEKVINDCVPTEEEKVEQNRTVLNIDVVDE